MIEAGKKERIPPKPAALEALDTEIRKARQREADLTERHRVAERRSELARDTVWRLDREHKDAGTQLRSLLEARTSLLAGLGMRQPPPVGGELTEATS